MSTQKLSFLSKILFAVNSLFAMLLVLSYGAYWIPPTVFGIFSFLSLAYPFLLLVNILFALFWILRLRRQALLSVVSILLGFFQLKTIINYKNTVEYPEKTIKVMTYNIRMFNFYSWLPMDGVPTQIEDFVYQKFPDVVSMQEYLKLKEPLRFSNLPHKYEFFTNKSQNFGLMIASRFPFIKKGVEYYNDEKKENNAFIYADIKIGSDTLRIINCHLASISLDNSDYFLLESPENAEGESIKNGLKIIINKIQKAFEMRTAQIRQIQEFVENSPYPIILTGDFNDTPSSYAYWKMTRKLKDSFRNTPPLKTKTYIRSHFPFRIDYIMHSKEMKTVQYEIVRETLSDHYPVMAEIAY